MQRSVETHIKILRARLDLLLGNAVANGISQAERNAIEAEIRAVQMALAHYQSAIELEKSIGEIKT